jgi:hypothetical protein
MRRALFLIAVFCVLFAAVHMQRVGAQDKPAAPRADEKDRASVWMKAKLDYSQKILAGLTRVSVRETLPIVKGGNTIGLFVWFDRVGP